jgi:hypothetical protein
MLLCINNQIRNAIAQAASHRLLTAEAGILAQVSPCGICGGQSGSGTDFSQVTLSLSFHRSSLFTHMSSGAVVTNLWFANPLGVRKIL